MTVLRPKGKEDSLIGKEEFKKADNARPITPEFPH